MNPGPYTTGCNDRMIDGIPGYIEAGDTAAADMHAQFAPMVLEGQLDPAEVSNTLADLAEADETPEETFLPPGIVDALAAALEG